MAKYICDVCGYEYDPSEEGKAFNELMGLKLGR